MVEKEPLRSGIHTRGPRKRRDRGNNLRAGPFFREGIIGIWAGQHGIGGRSWDSTSKRGGGEWGDPVGKVKNFLHRGLRKSHAG